MKSELLKPCKVRLDIARNSSQLMRYDLVRNDGFAKSMALRRISPALAQTSPCFAITANRHDEALLVKVSHDDLEAIVFAPKKVLYRYADVVEFHKGCATAFLAGVGDSARGDAWAGEWDDEHGESCGTGTAGTDSGGHVRGPWIACDPLLVSVHNVVLAVGGFDGCSLDIRYIGLW